MKTENDNVVDEVVNGVNDEMEKRCEGCRDYILSRLNSAARFYYDRLGEPCVITRRDYKSWNAVLLEVEFMPVAFTFYILDNYKQYLEKVEIREERIFRIEPKELVDIQFITAHEELPLREDEV